MTEEDLGRVIDVARAKGIKEIRMGELTIPLESGKPTPVLSCVGDEADKARSKWKKRGHGAGLHFDYGTRALALAAGIAYHRGWQPEAHALHDALRQVCTMSGRVHKAASNLRCRMWQSYIGERPEGYQEGAINVRARQDERSFVRQHMAVKIEVVKKQQ